MTHMTEIELKAHVYNKESLLNTLKTFATFEQKIYKSDVYYKNDKISVRIRNQISQKNDKKEEKSFFTYKKKEVIKSADTDFSTEVNDEKETELSDPSALEIFLTDAGFVPFAKKQKDVSAFSLNTQYGKAHIELCNVEPLGDFIEIEILSKESDSATIQNVQQELKNILKKCNISEDCIENRYYNDMIKSRLPNSLEHKD